MYEYVYIFFFIYIIYAYICVQEYVNIYLTCHTKCIKIISQLLIILEQLMQSFFMNCWIKPMNEDITINCYM